MVFNLEGKRILVTASTRGIGRGIAEVLLREGCKVVISGRTRESLEPALESLSSIGEVYGLEGDLRVREDVERLVRFAVGKLGGLDALVYVTGPPKTGSFEDLTLEDWEDSVKLLLLSAIWITRETLPHLLESRGSIVYLTSTAIREPIPSITLSNVVRLSIAGLTKSLAKELGSKGVRVNMVMPGWIETERVLEVVRSISTFEGTLPEDVVSRIKREIPIGRMGKPEEIGYLVAFLISDYASYINGASIPVDGGLLNHIF